MQTNVRKDGEWVLFVFVNVSEIVFCLFKGMPFLVLFSCGLLLWSVFWSPGLVGG